MENIVLAAFGAGVLSFFSPCVFPLAAGLLSIISGISLKEIAQGKKAQHKAGLYALCFFAGFALCFSLLGASSGFIGKFLSAHISVFNTIAGVLLIILGASLLDIIKMPAALHATKKFNISSLQPSYLGAFLTGLAFAFAWTPCLGPVLTGLVIMAAAQETATKGAALLFVYSLGLGLPFILISFFGGFFLGKMKNMNRFIKYTQKAMGILIIALGILFMTDIKILNDITH